jgi:hypothetical protein
MRLFRPVNDAFRHDRRFEDAEPPPALQSQAEEKSELQFQGKLNLARRVVGVHRRDGAKSAA